MPRMNSATSPKKTRVDAFISAFFQVPSVRAESPLPAFQGRPESPSVFDVGLAHGLLPCNGSAKGHSPWGRCPLWTHRNSVPFAHALVPQSCVASTEQAHLADCSS